MIIVDYKKKRKNNDSQWVDPLGVEEAKSKKLTTIEVPDKSDNVIYKFLQKWENPKLLLGKKVYCLNDRKEIMSGFIVDVLPPYYLYLKNKGIAKFDDVISMED